MQETEIKNYILSRSEIEVPALQKELSLSYGEAKAIIADLEKDGKLQFKSGVVYTVNQPSASEANNAPYKPQSDFEAKCLSALWVCIKAGTANSSIIQRRCPIGYAMAVSIVNWMERNNYVTQYPERKILITEAEYISKFGNPEAEDKDDDDDSNKLSTPSQDSTGGLFKRRDVFPQDDDDDVDVDKEIAEFIRNLEDNAEPDILDVKDVLSENISRHIKQTPSGRYVWEMNDKFDIWFEYLHESKVMRVSDDGAVFIYTSLSDRRIKNAIKKFPQVQYENEKIFIDVPKPADTFKAVLTLYSALDYLFQLN
ncbi:MAG: hypothetical protein K2O39_05540 [Clostridiales bacterium]|nr:hypothetical protein [Clostridiales bacterium]